MTEQQKSVARKYLDQQSVLLTWNGPWGEFSKDPLLHEQWPYFQVRHNGEGTLFFHSAQVFFF